MAPIARILLRYITLPLLALGLVTPDEQRALIGDPELVAHISTGLGFAAAAIAEGWYWIAKRFGWRT